MEKNRLLLAAGLSLGVLLLWEWVAPRRAPQRAAPTPVPAVATPQPAPAAAVPSERPAGEAVAATAAVSATLANDLLRATVSNRGGVLDSILLTRHTNEKNQPLELVRSLPPPAPRPLALDFPGKPELTRRVSEAFFVLEKTSGRSVRLRYGDAAVSVTKEIRLSAGYLFDVSVSVAGAPYTLLAGAGLRNPTPKEMASSFVMPATAVATSGGGLERIRSEKLEAPREWPLLPGGFAGIEDNYFLAVLIPRQPATVRIMAVPTSDAAGQKAQTVTAGLSSSGTLEARAYFGPKDVEVLEGLKLGLEKTVDFGWFGIVARPLLWLLKKAYSWVGNYGAAILLVTLLIRILIFPLMHKSYASMKKMQKLAPKMNAIRDKYKKAKTDAAQRAKMNQELMALYQAEGYNPMSGCFPMLLQLPILVAFYNVLSRAVELRHAPFVLWIQDLSAVDRSYVLLILMIVTMYAQQAMTPSTLDPTQKKIFMAMPILWAFFLKDMPSGLVLYWIFSNILTILQQLIINRLGRDDEPAAAPARADRKTRAPRARGAGR